MQGHKLVGHNSMHWGGGGGKDISDETTITTSLTVIKKDMNIFQLWVAKIKSYT
jgi:hypothetical protein